MNLSRRPDHQAAARDREDKRHKLWTGSQRHGKRPIEGQLLHTKTVDRKTERDRLLQIVTLAVSATVLEIFTVKDRKLLILPTPSLLDPPSGGTPLDIDVIYTPLKSAFSGLQFCRWHYRSIFIRLAVVASQSRQIARNSDNIWPYSSSRSSKVNDVGVNRKPMYDFLLVTNSNFGCICYRFRDIDAWS